MIKQLQHIDLNACKNGDRKALKRLYDLYADYVLALSKRYVGNAYFEDITQNTFVKVIQKIKHYKGTSIELKSWIGKIAINEALQFMRKEKKIRSEALDSKVILKKDAAIESQISAQEIKSVIYKIELNHRIVFMMYAIEGYSHNEIAEMLKIKPSSSRARLSRAKIMIQQELHLIKSIENERSIRL